MFEVKERAGIQDTSYFTRASTNQPLVPITVHWRLDCETTKQQLQDWTQVNPVSVFGPSGLKSAYVEIDIDGALNAIQNNRNSRELKKLWVACNKDLPNEFNDYTTYWVVNGRGRI